MEPERGRTIEFELGWPHFVGIAVLLLAIVAVAYLWTHPRGGESSPRTSSSAASRAPGSSVEDVHQTETVFDRAGGGGAERDPSRQVTNEVAAAGGLEVDLGVVPDRPSAERVRAAARAAGVTALVASEPNGAYRIVAGPFATHEDAQRAADMLRTRLGRPATVKP